MKRILICILMCIICFFTISCSETSLSIVNQNILVNEVFLVSKLGNEYSIHLPILTSQKIQSMQLEELVGNNINLIQCDLEFDNNVNIEEDTFYLNSFTLNFKCKYGIDDILITHINLVINSQRFSYNIGEVKITSNTNHNQSNDHVTFLSSPITGYDFDSTYAWEIKTNKDLKIKKIYTNSSIVDVSSLWINNELLSDANSINKTIGKNQNLEIHFQPLLQDSSYKNSIVGFDLIVEIEDLDSHISFITKAPAVFRIYGCGEQFLEFK